MAFMDLVKEQADEQTTLEEAKKQLEAAQQQQEKLEKWIEFLAHNYESHEATMRQLAEAAEAAPAERAATAEEMKAAAAEMRKAAANIKKYTKNSQKEMLITAAICAVLFCIPSFAAGWFFSPSADSPAERILWNQAYPHQPVTPFTTKEEFLKMKENQKTYIENEKQKAAAEKLKQQTAQQ